MTVSKSTLGVLVGEGGPGLQEQAWLAHARSEAWPGPGGSDLDPVLFCIFETYLAGVDLVIGFSFFFSQMAEVLPGLFSGYGTECIVTGV